MADGKAVTAAVRNTSFVGRENSVVALDKQGDRIESYMVLNYILAPDGVMRSVRVGLYNSTLHQYRSEGTIVWPGDVAVCPPDFVNPSPCTAANVTDASGQLMNSTQKLKIEDKETIRVNHRDLSNGARVRLKKISSTKYEKFVNGSTTVMLSHVGNYSLELVLSETESCTLVSNVGVECSKGYSEQALHYDTIIKLMIYDAFIMPLSAHFQQAADGGGVKCKLKEETDLVMRLAVGGTIGLVAVVGLTAVGRMAYKGGTHWKFFVFRK